MEGSLKEGLSSKGKIDQKKPRSSGEGERPPKRTSSSVALKGGGKGSINQ